MSDLIAFLRSRDVPESCLSKLQEEKIEEETISSISDNLLAIYVPKLGDRVALRNFCDKRLKNNEEKVSRRSQLFEVLRSKMRKMEGRQSADTDDEEKEATEKGKQIRKKTRKIEIGWIHNHRQVRKRTGGGTRKVDMSRNHKKQDILQESIKLFFPNGESTKGLISEFDADLLDFKESSLLDDVTLEECYHHFKTGILTFYLHTFDREKAESTAEPSTSYATKNTPKSETIVIADGDSNDEDLDSLLKGGADILAAAASAVGLDNDLTLPDLDDTDVTFNFRSKENTDTILPSISTQTVAKETYQPVEITIHRGPLCFTEIINAFKDSAILQQMITVVRILPNGEIERAEDTGGVLKDTITEFWQEFYGRCCVGREAKVPCLRHDFGEEEWKAVGRVMIYGWKELGYWPISISKTFIKNCLYPYIEISSDSLKADFYKFAARSDTAIFQAAAVDTSSIDEDELLEALDSYECKTRINNINVAAVVLEIAHRVLIQSPCFVSDCWKEVLGAITITQGKLDEVYQSLIPTNTMVCRLLAMPDPRGAQDEHVFKLLKRYVKELDDQKLQLFLRFCTGSDLLTVEKIEVQLEHMNEFERRPVAHTCGCVLQLGNDYATYMEFRNEFDNVLESHVWIMDVV